MQRGRAALAITLLALAGPAPALAQPSGDAPVFARIESLIPVAAAISIDGDGSDWGAIPSFPDPVGDATAGPETDITSVAIAPLDDALLLRIETAAAPPSAFLRFWVEIDFRSEQFRDVQVGLDATFDDLLWIYPEDAGAIFVSPWEHATLAIGNVLEARIPYAALEAELPASMQGQLSGAGARSWVRVRPYSVGPGGLEDWGAAVASFRLVPTPYPLDPTLPAGSEDPVETPIPLEGLQYVVQGAMTRPGRSHADAWAYDLNRVDHSLFESDPPESTDNADYLCFGEAIRAPVAGTVFSLENGWPDPDPPNGGPVNFLFLDIGNATGLLFSHTKQGSIPVVPSQAVAAGELVGEVGNAGAFVPHLHYEAREIGNGDPSQPLALTGVEVGLNPTADDPWRRRLDSWGIREGFLVQRASAAPVPAVPLWALAGLAASLVAALHARAG